jgi:hypothetical protein
MFRGTISVLPVERHFLFGSPGEDRATTGCVGNRSRHTQTKEQAKCQSSSHISLLWKLSMEASY